MNWTPKELKTIGNAHEIQIAPLKSDGKFRKATTIWVVPHENEVYVRAWNGPKSSWYRAAETSHQGRIWVNREEIEVSFVNVVDEKINDQIDQEYLDKYGKSQYTQAMIGSEQRKTTIKLIPRK